MSERDFENAYYKELYESSDITPWDGSIYTVLNFSKFLKIVWQLFIRRVQRDVREVW